MSGYSNGWGGNSYRSDRSRPRGRSRYSDNHAPYEEYAPREYAPRNSYNNQPRKKQNGCKVFQGKNGVEYISGWCNDRHKGFIKILVYRVAKSDEVHTSQSNRDWCSVRAKVTFSNGSSQVFNALLDVAANRVKIKDLNYILSPSKNYCGAAFKK